MDCSQFGEIIEVRVVATILLKWMKDTDREITTAKEMLLYRQRLVSGYELAIHIHNTMLRWGSSYTRYTDVTVKYMEMFNYEDSMYEDVELVDINVVKKKLRSDACKLNKKVAWFNGKKKSMMCWCVPIMKLYV